MYFNDITCFGQFREVSTNSIFRDVDRFAEIRCKDLIMKIDLTKDKLLSFLFQHKIIVGWMVESKVVFLKPAKKCNDF